MSNTVKTNIVTTKQAGQSKVAKATNNGAIVKRQSTVAKKESAKAGGYSKTMTQTTVKAQSRMEPELKEQAEAVFKDLGIKPSEVIRLLYKQVVLHRTLPFEISLPDEEFNKHAEQILNDHAETFEGLFHR